MSVLYCVTFHLSCWLTDYTVVGTALSALPPSLTVALPPIGPGASPAFSPGHLCESTRVRSQDCSSRVPGPSVVAMKAAQILTWPSLCVYVPTKPTAAETSPV